MVKKKSQDTVRTQDERHVLPCELTAHEKSEAAAQLGVAVQEQESIEGEKKTSNAAFAARLKTVNERIRTLAQKVREGKEHRVVECQLELNFTTGIATLTRLDTQVMVEERELSKDEKEAQDLYD